METCYLCLEKTTHIKCDDCNSNFCCTCSKFYHQQESTKKHSLTYLPSFSVKEFSKGALFCNIHKTEILKFYCRTCDYKLICLECMNDTLHKTHSYFTYKDLIDGFSDRLVEFENEYQQLLQSSSTITNSLNEIVFHRDIAFNEAKKEVEDCFARLEEKLREKKKFLLVHLETLHKLYKNRLNAVSDDSNQIIDQLNDKFLELGNFSLTERNNDILNQQKKLDEMNEFLERGKQLNYETRIFMDEQEQNLKIIPRISVKVASKLIEEIWFSEIQNLRFISYQKEDKLFIENLDGYSLASLFSEIREINNSVLFKDIQEYTSNNKPNQIEFELDAFSKTQKLSFQLFYKNSSNFFSFSTSFSSPKIKITTLNLTGQYSVPISNIWFSIFTDPVTDKLFFTSNYDSIYTVFEYENFEAFTSNVNRFKSLELEDFIDGTYIVAYKNYLYYNISKSNKIGLNNISTCKKEIEFGLKTPCFRNTASFRWGGLNDLAFILDKKTNKRYVLFQKGVEEQQTHVLEIDNIFSFDPKKSVLMPISKKSIGFCFVYDGIIYIGNYHYKPEIHQTFNLKDLNKGLEKVNIVFEKAQFITNITTIGTEECLTLLVSDYYQGVLAYKVNFNSV